MSDTTKYLCVHCDKTFEHEGAKKPRCPECMRVNGLEEVVSKRKKTADGEDAPERPPWLWWAVGVGVLAVVGVGYVFWADESADTVSGEPPLTPLDHGAVTGYLRAANVDPRDMGTTLVPSDEVAEWAEEAAGSASGNQGKAAALLEAIRDRSSEGAFERWSMGIPRETAPAASDRVLAMVQEDEAHHHLYPLELAALMAAGLRALDVPAMVAEIIRWEGDRRPPDPSGQLGYYGVAVYDDEAGEGDPTFYDPWGGREDQPSETRVLTDTQAIGALLSTRGLYLLSRESDSERAAEASSMALRLDGSSPSNRAVRGAILIANGQPDDGLDELSAAKQLRTDAPRRNLIASVFLAQQDLDAASREVSAALEEYPEFAAGRATLAAIHLSRSENDLARSELEEAQRIDPDLHLLPQLWANYYAATGDIERAVAQAEEAVSRNGDIQSRLMAARIYRQASRYDRMRREAHAILERTPAARQEAMREILQRLLGPTALEPVDEDLDEMLDEDLAALDEEGEGDELGDPGSFSLESPTLGTGGGDGPSLLGGDSLGGGGGGLQLGGGGGPSLGGGGGGGLQLNLNE